MIRVFLLFVFVFTGFSGSAQTLHLAATGTTQSLLEQCGCTTNIAGGLEARAGYLDLLRKKPEPILLLDVGGFLPETQEAIDLALAKTYVQGIQRLNYTALGCSPADLAFGYETLASLVQAASLEIVVTNLVSADAKPAFWNQFLVREIEGIRVGIVALPQLNPKSFQSSDFRLLEPLPTLESVVTALRTGEKVDWVILLVHDNPITLKSWFSGYQGPRIDLILTEDFGMNAFQIGETWVMNAGGKGKSLGLATISSNPQKKIQTLEYQRVMLDPQVYRHRGIRADLNQAYRHMIATLRLDEAPPSGLLKLDLERDPQNGYVGVEGCIECHEPQYKQWRETAHSFTFNRLLKDNRHWVPECLTCHTTGYGHPHGFKRFPDSFQFAHVQCETCHGPGGLHVQIQDKSTIRRVPSLALCKECHDQKNSPEFDPYSDLYHKQIVH